jgi:myo-inositol-1(or 4)-monophosphatase
MARTAARIGPTATRPSTYSHSVTHQNTVRGDADGPEFRPETLLAVNAVARAMELAAGGVKPGDISSKGNLDVVTTMDVAVEDLIRTAIEDCSQVPVVGEERGGDIIPAGFPFWLVDPICGTRNFAAGIPLYAVNVALVENDHISIGVVGDPSTGDIGIAERGRGAWALKDKAVRPLRVSDESETVVIETGRADGERREASARFAAEAIRVGRWELRSLSTTLSLHYVASGRMSAYVLFYGSVLHTGAGSLLAGEAGAVVSDVKGHPWTIHSDSVVAAATPELHKDLLQLRQT